MPGLITIGYFGKPFGSNNPAVIFESPITVKRRPVGPQRFLHRLRHHEIMPIRTATIDNLSRRRQLESAGDAGIVSSARVQLRIVYRDYRRLRIDFGGAKTPCSSLQEEF